MVKRLLWWLIFMSSWLGHILLAQSSWLSHIILGVSVRCFWTKLTFESVDEIKHIALLEVAGLIQSVGGSRRKERLTLPWVEGKSSGLKTSSCDTGIFLPSNYLGSPVSPACQQQILELSLHNCVGQFLITNLLIYTDSPWLMMVQLTIFRFCDSVKPICFQ